MDEQARFRTALAALRASAEAGDRRLTEEQMQDFFRDMELSGEQRQPVYAYLASKRIRVEGVPMPTVPEGRPYTDEEREFLRQYRKDMRRAAKQPPEEIHRLFESAADGDALSKKLLTEHYMELAFELAEEYAHQELMLQDLVQEGNLGLMVGIDTLGLKEEGISWEAYLDREIRRSIQRALDEQAGAQSVGEQVADKLNRLADSITEITEELGREVTPDELSLYLDMPLEEIEALLGIAGENIETADTGKETDR